MLKGSVIDLAVAVVIGGAFGKVVNALANNILMPLISYLNPAEGAIGLGISAGSRSGRSWARC